jgi:hypothetical protein
MGELFDRGERINREMRHFPQSEYPKGWRAVSGSGSRVVGCLVPVRLRCRWRHEHDGLSQDFTTSSETVADDLAMQRVGDMLNEERAVDGHRPEPAQTVGTAARLIDATNTPPLHSRRRSHA